eukprot:5605427-Pyramimonas_sp.AAC.4
MIRDRISELGSCEIGGLLLLPPQPHREQRTERGSQRGAHREGLTRSTHGGNTTLCVLSACNPDMDWNNDALQSVGVMVIGTFARMGTYVTMTTIATSMGIVEGAAHKVAFESYYLLSFGTEPLFTAATSLLPRDMKLGVGRAVKLRKLLFVGATALG